MGFEELFEALFGALLAGPLLWQLVSGKALNASWEVAITRRDRPLAYWAILAAQTALVSLYFVQTYA